MLTILHTLHILISTKEHKRRLPRRRNRKELIMKKLVYRGYEVRAANDNAAPKKDAKLFYRGAPVAAKAEASAHKNTARLIYRGNAAA